MKKAKLSMVPAPGATQGHPLPGASERKGILELNRTHQQIVRRQGPKQMGDIYGRMG